MKFGPIPLEHAENKILGHNIAGPDGRRALRKGKALTVEDVALLRDIGRKTVYVAELEPDDVEENMAASRVAQAVTGAGLRLSGPAAGRMNLMSTTLGVLRVDVEKLARLNACSGITLATLPSQTAVPVGKMAGTVKILPFAVPEATVQQAEAVGSLIQIDALSQKTAVLILSGSPSAKERIIEGFDPPVRTRLAALNATLQTVEFIPLEDEQDEMKLAAYIHSWGQRVELVILAGETAVMDRYDMAPRAIERAGGAVTCFGAPVDPGNLLLLAYLGDVPILGAPGCVRSLKANIVDWVLPRLLVGDYLTHADIFALGHGGLLEDVPERPSPRSRVPAE